MGVTTGDTEQLSVRELLFQVSVWLKGLDALLEVIGGVALLAVTPAFILRAVAFLTQDELAEDPRDLVANTSLEIARQLSVGTEHFVAFYLLTHGIVKLVLVVALLRRIRLAYPMAMVVFGAFIAYQLYRFSLSHSLGLVALSLFDFGVICVVWLECLALKREAASEFL
jgi:uncharacterized membrane protein